MKKPFSYTELIIPLIKKGKDYSDFLLPRVDHFFYGELIQGYATHPRKDDIQYHTTCSKNGSYEHIIQVSSDNTHVELLKSDAIYFRLYAKIDSDVCVINIFDNSVVLTMSNREKFDLFFENAESCLKEFKVIWNEIKILMLENNIK